MPTPSEDALVCSGNPSLVSPPPPEVISVSPAVSPAPPRGSPWSLPPSCTGRLWQWPAVCTAPAPSRTPPCPVGVQQWMNRYTCKFRTVDIAS